MFSEINELLKIYGLSKQLIKIFKIFGGNIFIHLSTSYKRHWAIYTYQPQVFVFLKDLLFLHQCIYNIIIERTYKIK
jgi:hypothetical protein